MKKLKILLLAAMALALMSCLVACNARPSPATEDPPKATSFVAVDINPSIELVLDQNDNVMSAYGANGDARAMLFDAGGIVNAKLGVALANIVQLAKDYGYITEDRRTVSISAYSLDEKNDSELFLKASEALASFELDVQKDLDLASKFEIERAGYDMSVGKYRMLSRAMACSDASSLPSNDSEALKTVNDYAGTYDSKLGTLYKRTVAEARFALQNTRQIARDGLYSVYFVGKTLHSENIVAAAKNSAKVLYANVYAVLNSTENTLSHYYNSLKEYIQNPILTFDDVKDAFKKVGSFFKNLTEDIFEKEIADENGEITKTSVRSYMNELYRNLDASARPAFEEAYEEVMDIVEQGEEDAIERKDSQSIKDALAAILSSIKQKISELNEQLGISEKANAVFTKIWDAMNGVSEWLGLDKIDFKSLFDVNNTISKISEAKQSVYDKMELTEEDIEGVKQLESSITSTLEEAKETFDQAMQAAKNSAEEWLESVKNRLDEIKL